VAPTQFPAAGTPLIHRVTAYSRAALWDRVQRWFAGGPVADSRISPAASAMHTFKGEGYATWEIAAPKKTPIDWAAFAKSTAIDAHTYGYHWGTGAQTRAGITTLPEYYRWEQEKWSVAEAKDVPSETGLTSAEFPRAPRTGREPYVTPTSPDSPWKRPGPKAGPFRVKIGDGSTVTYWWYRFVDQPAVVQAGYSVGERNRLQARVERLHRAWTKDREYLAPPTVGKLASLDPTLFVKPPKGMEVGYVPIVTRQEP
jgi:hypothetical protein